MAATVRTLDARVEILSVESSLVKISGKLSEPRKNWSMVDSYANADNLSGRISALKFFDEKGREISFTKQGEGKFETEQTASSFAYEIKIVFPKMTSSAAHVSWLTKERGLLMPGDLFPDFADEAVAGKIKFVLPANWKIATSDDKTGDNEFQAAEISRSVFLIGDFSEKNMRFEKNEINLARAGSWSFTETETLELISTILAEEKKVFGAIPVGRIQILLLPFAQKAVGEQWEAETRGGTIVLLAAQIDFKSRALSKLHEQLRHELFHLWIPNSLNLTGDYAWFYEGFTIYQALKTGVKLKYIRFEDYLDALSRAFDAARQTSSNKDLSLIAASRLRWRGNFSEFVYAKGMIVAFLCDIALLEKSNGKKSLDQIFKEIYRSHQQLNAPQEATQAVLKLFKDSPELRAIANSYLEIPNAIGWNQELETAGLQNISKISLTKLAVKNTLNGRQKKVLVALGYQVN